MRLIIILSIVTLCASAEVPWNPFSGIKDNSINFIEDQSTIMKAFLNQQRDKVGKVFSSSYESAIKVKDSMNNYVEEQQKKISNEINGYMESIKENGRRVSDTWSYVPREEEGAKLDNPDLVLSVPAIVASHGYDCETHTVISNGYVLRLHRIPRSKSGKNISKKTVLLQHGLFASSADWILNGPEKGLAYVLADAGYDVWMSNIRGNKYSREHAWLKTDSKTYWNFSWHDVAEFDIPNIIDYIMRIKGTGTKITYIGHSMGTTILFAMLTLRPEYNDILSAGIALAPVVFMSDLKSPLKTLAPIASNVAYMEMMYGSHEFVPKNSALGKLSTSCNSTDPDSVVCKNFIFYLCGYNEKQFNKQLVPVFLHHLGTGTSWKTTVHFAQEIVGGGKFQMFDYGQNHNEKVYGTESPQEYDLSKVKLPIALFWAENDLLSSEKDVMTLYDKLPKDTTYIYRVPDPEFNHLDYLLAVDAPTLLNYELLKYVDRHNEDNFRFEIRLFQ